MTRTGANCIAGRMRCPITPQVFDLLEYLIRNRERVVSKDDLISAVWNGRIVSDAALTTRLNAARSAIGDTGEKQHLIKTLPRKGFRFVGTVQEDAEAAQLSGWFGGAERRRDAKPASAPRLSIVVLPFANLSGDPEQDYFADGVTESLTTDLSRISGSFVIGRHTAFTYKGKAVDLKQIGRELNVRYVLEGSVQRGGNRLRVNVQLIDAETGNHLWAERFDKPVADLFDMQDEIVSRLANTLNAQLIAAEARRAERSLHPDAMDLYFQGMAWLNKGWTPENMTQARGFFERALALDPGNIEALVGMARVDASTGASFMTDDRAAHLAAAETTLIKALSMAPQHALAHVVLGIVQIVTNRAAQGIAECERALALDRNLADAHAFIGVGKIFLGRGAETEGHVHEALRLSPRDTLAYLWMMFVGGSQVTPRCGRGSGRLVSPGPRGQPKLSPRAFPARCRLGASRSLDEARAATQAGLALDPGFTLRRLPPIDRVTIRLTSPDANASIRVCAWPGCRRANVGDGSIASVYRTADRFRSFPNCGHHT